MKINWEKRKDIIKDTLLCCGVPWSHYFLSSIISQEQSMLEKLEADKVEVEDAIRTTLNYLESFAQHTKNRSAELCVIRLKKALVSINSKN